MSLPGIPILESERIARDDVLVGLDIGVEGPVTLFVHPLMHIEMMSQTLDERLERVLRYISARADRNAREACDRIDRMAREPRGGRVFRAIMRDLNAL